MLSAFSRLSRGLSGGGARRPSVAEARRQRARRKNTVSGRNTVAGCGSVERLESRALLAVDVLSPIGAQSLNSGDAATKIDLADHFDETTITGTVVQFTNNSIVSNDTFYIELFDKAGPERTRTTPLTAANFLSYVDAGSYDGSMIHRSVLDFVVQGGGYYAPTLPADQVGSNPTRISEGPTVANEPGNSNIRGTIAMAKLGGLPDSATSQWFFNMGDNSANLDAQNGGFTAFGRVLGDGMDAVGAMGEAQTYDASNYYGDAALNELPLWNAPADNENIVRPDDFLTFTSIDRAAEVTYTVQSSAPNVVTAAMEGTNLVLTPSQFSGVSTVTVTATSVADATASAQLTFNVNVTGGTTAPTPESVMSFTSTGLWLLNKSDGSEFTQSTFAIWSTAIEWDAVLEGDFNGDGLMDVAGRTNIGQWWSSINEGDGTAAAPDFMIYWKPSLNITKYVSGDFDGDGRTDVAGISSTGVWWAGMARTDTIGFSNSRMGAWSPNLQFTTIETGDFDGDGKTDIAGLATTGQWVGLVSKAGGGWETKNLGFWSPTLNFTSDIVSGDFNGDGKTDIAGRTAAGQWWAAIANADSLGFTNTLIGGWSTAVSWNSVNVGDFNGDGKTDIIARTNIGQWWGLMSDGTDGLRSNSHIGYWNPNVTWTAIIAGDADGDGRDDLIGRVATSSELARGRLWVAKINDGALMTTTKWGFQSIAPTVESRDLFFANF
jgi:cyclophilin family peptidyl-prolyl cis-trans isomerase